MIDLSFYKPHPKQAEVHTSRARVKVLETARRWGKSRAALMELLKTYVELLEVPVDQNLQPPFHAWIVCPSYPQAGQAWIELLAFVPEEMRFRVDVDAKALYLRGTDVRPWGLVEIKSAFNPEALQTVGLDFLWVNEAQDVPDAAFERLLPTTRSPQRAGKIVYEGIPSLTADHWFRRMFVMAARGDRLGYEAFKYTVYDNPLLSAEDVQDIEADRELLPEATWRRMYMAEFSAEASGLRNIDTCVQGDLLPMPIPGGRYVAGVDLGRINDATVLCVMDAEKRRLVGHQRWDPGNSWVYIRESVIHQAFELWGCSRVIVDAQGAGDMFCDELAQAGLPVEPFLITVGSREPLLTALALALERQTISYPPVPSLLRELRAIQHRKLSPRTWRLEAPPGYHDDEVFALALALTACDPPQALTGVRPLFAGTRRYVPTQEEAEGGGLRSSFGHRFMERRRATRFAERWGKTLANNP